MEEQIKSEKSNTEFLIKFLLGSIFVISILVVIGMSLGSETSLKIPIWIAIITFILFFVSLFFRKIANILQKIKDHENNSKNPISEEEVEKKIKGILEEEIWNHKKVGFSTRHFTHTINGNLIYESHVPLLYPQKWKDGQKEVISNTAIFIINANYPNIKPVILEGCAEDKKVNNAVNRISQNPEISDTEETEISTDAFNRPIQRTRRTIHQPKEEQKKEESVI